MQRVFAFIGALLALGLPFFVFAAARPLPAPTNYINDYANVLSDAEESTLNNTLKAYEDSSSNQIFVAIVTNLGGQDIESYAGDVFRAWQIGQKDKDNGILIVASIEDDIRRIEIGYGLEGEITDGQAGTIIRQTVKPAFQAGEYYQGLTKTIEQIEAEISGAIETESTSAASNGFDWIEVIFGLMIVGLQLIFASLRWLAKSKSVWQGALLGAILGGLVGVIVWSVMIGLASVILLGLFGWLIDIFLSRTYKPGSFVARSDRMWFLGGGRGFGGGGFGGGGGSSGGGGASG